MKSFRALRGLILDFLKSVYPTMVLELDIIGVFYQDYRDKHIRQALAYLVDKGYVEKIKKLHPVHRYEKQVFYRLTAKGIDIYEGTIRDEGVLLED
ncbi:MAG: hypothetical protein DRQ02_10455 [Candidatus Latescibacterota bacterium]|nr:MAG: hypothetical protein DRQ02_10455 [Candidatus Latescibacterota bacterium]